MKFNLKFFTSVWFSGLMEAKIFQRICLCISNINIHLASYRVRTVLYTSIIIALICYNTGLTGRLVLINSSLFNYIIIYLFYNVVCLFLCVLNSKILKLFPAVNDKINLNFFFTYEIQDVMVASFS